MPANGRWDLIRRLKVKFKAATTAALRSVFFCPPSITKYRQLFFVMLNEKQNFPQSEHNLRVSLLLYMNILLKSAIILTKRSS